MKQKKILIIQTAFMGDAILTLPMIQVFAKEHPLFQIDVIAIPSTAEIFESSPYVDKVLVLDKRGKQKSLMNLAEFISSVRKENYDRIYSPHRSLRTSLIVLFSGVKETFGFDTAAFSFFYKTKIKYESGLHEVARNLKLIGYEIYNENWKIKPEILAKEDVIKKIDFLMQKISGKKIIAIAPGSVWETKKYPADYFAKVIEHFTAKNCFIALMGGAGDKILCDSLVKKNIGLIENFAGSLSVTESIEFLKRCSLVICNDSAPTHMGMIAGVATLTIYCSTVPQFGFYPYNQKSDCLSYDELSCKPCGIHGRQKCPINTFACGYKLMPGAVIQKAEKLIA